MKSIKSTWKERIPIKKDYLTVLGYGQSLHTIKKSKFIGYCIPVQDEAEALSFIQDIKKTHYDARHNAYAYRLHKDHDVKRFSDDGEPSGTAGLPILSVLEKEGLTDLCVVVTRYFGGVLLGASGLIRAYCKAAAMAVQESKIVVQRYHFMIKLILDYEILGKVENYLTKNLYTVIQKYYEEKVTFLLYVSETSFHIFAQDLKDMSHDEINLTILQELYLPTIGDELIIKDGVDIIE